MRLTVFEKNDRAGGLLRYGIPDFKMEKGLIDRRIEQMELEGVTFRTGVYVGGDGFPAHIQNGCARDDFAEGAARRVRRGGDRGRRGNAARDLPVPGRDLQGTYFAMEFQPQQNKVNAGDLVHDQLKATGKHVIVIGGGDTGSDCVGTSNRHGAASVTQSNCCHSRPRREQTDGLAVLADQAAYLVVARGRMLARLGGRDQRLEGSNGKIERLIAARVEWKDGRMQEVPDSEFEMKADLVLLAMGFVAPVAGVLDAFGVDKDARGNAARGDRRRQGVLHECRQGLRGGRYAPRPVARGLGRSVKGARPRARSMRI